MSGVVTGLVLLAAGWVAGAVAVAVHAAVGTDRSAAVWGAIALVGGYIGVVLYATLGRRSSGRTLRNWRNRNGSPSHVCESCGAEFFVDPSVSIDVCRSCGRGAVRAT